MLTRGLGFFARTGRVWLVVGLLCGILLDGPPQVLARWLPELVAFLLFLNAFRIGAAETLGQIRDARASLAAVLALQLALPLAALALASLTGLIAHPMAQVFVLLTAAPAVTASVNFTLLLGRDPAPALRLLILGTALVPLTALPILWALPLAGEPAAALSAALRLMATIAASVAAGFALRALAARNAGPALLTAIDGVSVIALAVIVVGLMSAIGPALKTRPGEVALWLGFALAANLGLQVAAALLLSRARPGAGRLPLALIAGNRNIALFLVALPPETVAPLLIFLGCYQVPMYLTPLIMARFYARVLPPDPAGQSFG